MKYLIGILLLCVSFAINADNININGKQIDTSTLPAEQQKVISQIISSKSDILKVEDIKAYSEIGKTISSTLSQVVKDLNVNMNDFAKSRLGEYTLILLIWHFAGGMIYHLFIGLLILFISLYCIRKIKQVIYPREVIYDKDKTNIFGNPVITEVNETPIDINDGFAAIYIFLHILLFFVVIVTMFSY